MRRSNTYEAPGCQDTDYPYQRFACFFPLFSGAVVTWQGVLAGLPYAGGAETWLHQTRLEILSPHER